MDRERDEVRVPEALPDPRRLRRGRDRAVEVALRLALEHRRDQEIPLLDAVAPLALDQPPGPAEPAAGARHLSLLHEVDADPEGATRGPQRLAAVQVGLMCVFESFVELVLPAEHVGGSCQPLEVVVRQGRLPVGL
jgi:hypothetical protein